MQGMIKAGLLGCLMLLAPLMALAGPRVWFLYDAGNQHHLEFMQEGEALLRQRVPGLELRRLELAQITQLGTQADAGHDLLITLGNEAAQQAAGFALPTLNALITGRTFALLSGSYTSPLSALFLEQPLERQLQLIKIALPQRNRLTVLLGGSDEIQRRELEEGTSQLGLQLRVIVVDEESAIDRLFGSDILAEDTLLLLPDPVVVNRNTVKPLVLGSYRQGVPLVGYSQALVKAGALMAVHSSLPQLEAELAEMVREYVAGGALPEPHYARAFEVSVNYQLARALGLSMPSEESLHQALRERAR